MANEYDWSSFDAPAFKAYMANPPKKNLDTIVNNYTDSRGQGIAGQTTAGAQAGAQRNYAPSGINLQADVAAKQSALDALWNQAYETSGGVNWATVNALKAQRDAAAQNYATNKADAENMYGMLSTDASTPSTGLIGDIQSMGTQLQDAYAAQIQGSQDLATARSGALTTEQQRQQANRERVAQSLGVAAESIQTPYASDTALNKGVSDVMASAGSWENLLGTQKLGAQAGTDSLVTGAANTRNQTVLNMKNYLDQQQAQLDAQIAAEKSQTPTKKLTALGRMLEAGQAETAFGLAQQQFPGLFGAPQQPDMTAAQQLQADLGMNTQQYADAVATANAKFSDQQNAGVNSSNRLTAAEQAMLNATGLPQYLLNAG